MSNEKPILSFAIPTWNRAKELRECLNSIIPQIVESNENVEIVISDNASTDETSKIAGEYSSKYKFIRYFRNEKNVGPDLNFIYAIEKSNGEYAWLFSDDDWLADGALKEILRIIKEYHPCYISSNYYYANSKNELPFMNRFQKKYMVKKDKNKIGINEMLDTRNHWLSFISSNIFNKENMHIEKYKHIIEQKIIEWGWVHVYIVGDILDAKKCGYISSYFSVISRTGNGRANSVAFTKFVVDVFEYTFKEFKVNKKTSKKVINGIRKTFLSLKGFLKIKNKDKSEISPLLIPFYYKLFSIIPSEFIIFAWKLKRFLAGKGFSLPKES